MTRAVQLKDKDGNKVFAAPWMPIGSIFLTVSDTNPSQYFGGTWEKLSGGFLYGCQTSIDNKTGSGTNTFTAGSGNTGSTALTVDQIPSHNHYIYAMTGANQWAVGYLWCRAAGPEGGNSEGGQSGSIYSHNTGGGKGHTHTIPNHQHSISYIGVWVWKRVK